MQKAVPAASLAGFGHTGAGPTPHGTLCVQIQIQRQRQEKQKQACLQFILVYCLHSVVLASLNVPLELS